MTRPYRVLRLPYDPIDRIQPAKSALARTTRVTRRTIQRWANNGVPYDKADLIAVALGHHPNELWPNYDTALDDHRHARLEHRRAVRAARRRTVDNTQVVDPSSPTTSSENARLSTRSTQAIGGSLTA